uniref:Transposase Helix-turn-helix domain-containing protein n=1 Tax=Amphimedon queenslandica TaxID=400682 RepID=A0A1X7SVF5_AMPQE
MIKRSIWVRARSGDWWNSIVRCTFNDDDWRENFRVIILNLGKAIPTEKRVAITLWKLATNCEYRTIGHLFGVAHETVCVIVNDVCKAIVKNLFSKYIRLPKGERLSDIVKILKKSGAIHNVLGQLTEHIYPLLHQGLLTVIIVLLILAGRDQFMMPES